MGGLGGGCSSARAGLKCPWGSSPTVCQQRWRRDFPGLRMNPGGVRLSVPLVPGAAAAQCCRRGNRRQTPVPAGGGAVGRGAWPRAGAGAPRSGPADRRRRAASARRRLGGPARRSIWRAAGRRGPGGRLPRRSGLETRPGRSTARRRGGGMRGGAAGVRPGPGEPAMGLKSGDATRWERPNPFSILGPVGARGPSSLFSWARRVVSGGGPCEGRLGARCCRVCEVRAERCAGDDSTGHPGQQSLGRS